MTMKRRWSITPRGPARIGTMPLTIRTTIARATTIATTTGVDTGAGRSGLESCSDVPNGGCGSFIGDARAEHSTRVVG